MGTMYRVKMAQLPRGISQNQIHDKIKTKLAHLNALMSTYSPDSEVSRFNRLTGDGWFNVAPETVRVVAKALEISRRTSGAFDVTVGPLVELWGFGPSPADRMVPSEENIEKRRAFTGYKFLQARNSPPAIRKLNRHIRIDLSAIAKGFAVDQVASLLEEAGIEDYMIEIGGEVRTRGTRPNGQPWTIGVQLPLTDAGTLQQTLPLGDRAMATSGDYRNFFEQDGKRYSHLIDPRTGRPVTHHLASVSVVAETCMEADAWATALMVLGPDAGLQFATDHNLAALFQVRNRDGFTSRASPLYQRWFGKNEV